MKRNCRCGHSAHAHGVGGASLLRHCGVCACSAYEPKVKPAVSAMEPAPEGAQFAKAAGKFFGGALALPKGE